MNTLIQAYTSSDAAEFSKTFKSLPSSEKIRVRESENPIPCQAARRGRRKILEVCMDIDPWCLTATDKDFRNPLHWAAIGGDLKMCQMLLEKRPPKVKIDKIITVADNDGMVVLHCAALSGNENLLCFLLEQGDCAGAICQNKDGIFPIQLACMKGYASAVQKLCKSKWKSDFEGMCDSCGSTLLHLAVMEGHCGVARVLLEEGVCDTTTKDKDGSTALGLAEDLEDEEMAALLRQFANKKAPPAGGQEDASG